ncbi:serine hydrolase [Roseospira marina]|uniref:Serine hydrolase n=1 Tax=Roseospira marina TaxID=140057 RepID=A0A5M6IAE9_9PROT|nr:serine hydrolase [Roseospira marina]KAA5604699.1 serine hydrolase [Roseospira marina]MBB4315147.1 CubicO group peptidase (beta-lactamase class C family) [Roseospira marina]MBB5088083.1 CubicO group peptidase (beta-lactamase class C family) [Roseospira marina]
MTLSRRHVTARMAATLAVTATLPWARPARALARTPAEAAGALDAALERLPQLHSLQVRRGADVVFAEAPRGGGLDAPANIKSCSKSLVALLLGVAIDRGEVTGVDAPLRTVAPGLIPEDATEGVGGITLEDLVTLRAGLEATSGAHYGAWVGSNNWIAHALRRPMVARPGGRMIYSTGSTHVLGAALTEATGKSLLAQARERLGQPMGFAVPPWTRDPQGYYFGGNQMALTPRAMLDVATMVRDGGTFDGTQVVSADWMRASLEPRTVSPWSGMDYGYGWFLTGSGYAMARGYGGQVIAAHPERALAVAITSDPTQPARSGGYFGDLMDLLDGPILDLA